MQTAGDQVRWVSWMLRTAWLTTFGSFFFAFYHAGDRDPFQWGSAFLFLLSLTFAIVLTLAYYAGTLLLWMIARRQIRARIDRTTSSTTSGMEHE